MKALLGILILSTFLLQLAPHAHAVDLNIAMDFNLSVGAAIPAGSPQPLVVIDPSKLDNDGNYLIFSSAHAVVSTGAARGETYLRQGGSIDLQTKEHVESPSGAATEWIYNSFRKITLSGDQNVSLWGNALTAGTTIAYDEALLIAIPLNPYLDENVDWWYDENTTIKANMDNTFASNVGARVTFTPDGTSDYLIFGNGQITVDAVDDDVLRMEISDGTTQYAVSMRDGEDLEDVAILFAMTTVRKPPPVSTTYQLRFNGDTTGDHNSSRLFILRLNAFAAHDFNSVDENAGISSTENTRVQLQFTNPTDSNVIALWGGLFKHELGVGGNNKVQLRTYIDSNNVIAGASPRLRSWNNHPGSVDGSDALHYGVFWNANPGKNIQRLYRSTMTGETTLGTDQHNNRQSTVVVFTTRLAETPTPSAASTVFIFDVVLSTGHTVTYGGNCTTSAFFYNEMDANHDPDSDGNAARVKPRPIRFDFTTVKQDVNYLGITNPSSTHTVNDKAFPTKPPADNNVPVNEITTAEYGEISEDDTSIFGTVSTDDENYPTVRLVFKPPLTLQKIRDLNFFMIGNAGDGSGLLTCGTNNFGPNDLNLYVWNYNQARYEQIASFDNTGGAGPAAKKMEAIISNNVAHYISTDGNITFVLQGIQRTFGSSNKSCISIDYVDLNVTYYPTSTDFCQSSTLTPFTITNTGGAATNIDANFSTAFAGDDLNIVLKAWMGNGIGCGADGNGLGGWEKDCSITSTTSAVTPTQCKTWNNLNATTNSRLVTSLGAGDTNQICFSGDLNSFVPAGDHNKIYQTGN